MMQYHSTHFVIKDYKHHRCQNKIYDDPDVSARNETMLDMFKNYDLEEMLNIYYAYLH